MKFKVIPKLSHVKVWKESSAAMATTIPAVVVTMMGQLAGVLIHVVEESHQRREVLVRSNRLWNEIHLHNCY